MRSVAILVDGSNMHATFRALGFTVDWYKVIESVQSELDIHKAMYFTAMKPEGVTSTIRPLVDYLENNGWIVVKKPVSTYNLPGGGIKMKGNVDVEMTVEAMKLHDKVSDVMLFTGDGDFTALVKALQDKGVRVTVVSSRRSNPSMVSGALVRAADVFVDLVDMQPWIQRILPTG